MNNKLAKYGLLLVTLVFEANSSKSIGPTCDMV